MVRGLYTAYTGLRNQEYRLDTLTNNLANSATTGYKKEGTTTESFEDLMMSKLKDGSEGYIDREIGKVTLGVKIGENYTDYEQGSLKETGNYFDLAISGRGFFELAFKNRAGEDLIKYSRDGSLTLNKEGFLVTKDGDYVQGQNGNIQVSTTAKIVIDDQGNIFENGQRKDKIKLTDFEDYNYLKKYGENMYEEVEGAVKKDSTASVIQGFLEMSNVNVITEMIEMITITRQFETNQKFVQTVDTSLEKDVTLGNA